MMLGVSPGRVGRVGSTTPATGGEPVPFLDHDWSTGEYLPSADTFSASTARVLTGADGKTLTEFDIDTLRRRDGFGALIEPSRTRLTGPPTDLSDTNYFVLNGSPTLTNEGVFGSFAKILMSGASAVSFIFSGAVTVTTGALYSVKHLVGEGTSGAVRSRLRSPGSNTYSEIRGAWDQAPITSETLGDVTNLDFRSYGAGLTELVYTTAANADQSDVRLYIGPNDALTIYAYGMQVVAEPHAGEWITVAGGVTGSDLLTRDITGDGLLSAQMTFALHGWAAGVTEAVILQLDDGDDADRMALVVDTATLALKAIYEVGGSRIAELTLGTIDLFTVYSAGMVWGDGAQLAQVDGNAAQADSAAGAVPAFATMRVGKAASGGDAYLRAVSRKAYDKALTASQLAGVLAAAASPFELEAIDVTPQDRVLNLGGETFDMSTGDFPDVLRGSKDHASLIESIILAPNKSPYDILNDRPYYRTEIDGTVIRNETELWLAFDFIGRDISNALPFGPSASALICQLKVSPDESGVPAFTLSLHSDCLRVMVGGAADVIDPNPGLDRTNVALLPPLAQGRAYRFIARVQLGHDGSGELDLWQDGVQVVSETGLTIGYPTTTRCWEKFGLYCNDSIEYMHVAHANMACGSDLSHLLDRPYPSPF